MQLKTYLGEKKITVAEFGVLVGASEFGVRKWISGERTPRPEAMRKIADATDGAVTANDFVGQVAA